MMSIEENNHHQENQSAYIYDAGPAAEANVRFANSKLVVILKFVEKS